MRHESKIPFVLAMPLVAVGVVYGLTVFAFALPLLLTRFVVMVPHPQHPPLSTET